MRILLLVPLHKVEGQDKLWKKTGLPYYQAHNFWYKALMSLGHEVELCIYSGKFPVFDYYSFLARNFIKKLNIPHKPFDIVFRKFVPSIHIKQEDILTLSKKFKPNLLILSGNTDNVFPETLYEIKKLYKTKLVLLNGLSPVLFATKTEREIVRFFDYVFTNDKYHAVDWLMLGARKAVALPVSAIDKDFHRPYPLTKNERRQFSCDVSFVGGLYPDHLYQERRMFLEKLTRFNLKIWSPNRQKILRDSKLNKFYKGEAYGKKMLKIFSTSKINLNFHGNTMQAGGNLRTFEIPASGGFELVDRVNPNWYRNGREIVTFNSIDDLKRKIDYYLTHAQERKTIARTGYKRTLKDHTYKRRFIKMLEILSL